jgi:Ca2+-dependent lipid-binding protein
VDVTPLCQLKPCLIAELLTYLVNKYFDIVVEGKGLKDKETFGKQDPYVKLSIDSQVVKSKTHQNGGKTPSWNQNLFLNILPGMTVMNLECWYSKT